jgi:hypothetical protein
LLSGGLQSAGRDARHEKVMPSVAVFLVAGTGAFLLLGLPKHLNELSFDEERGTF